MHEQIPPVLIVFPDEAVLQKEDETEAAEAICMNVAPSESTWEGWGAGRQKPWTSPADQKRLL